MCGIAGVWGAQPLTRPQRLAERLSRSLAHRGPDGEGFLGIGGTGELYFSRSSAGLGDRVLTGLLVHRRLSIIDLMTGDQPMALAGERLWIVFNGEIYNYPALKREISSLEPDPFRTTSDTEVILRVYRRFGVEGFRRLNGMFAFALFDADRRELILARDPVGVKPLYWSMTGAGAGVAFASEIRGLQASEFVDREISPEGLAQFLFYRFVPSPGTIWRQVRKVPPGYALRFGADGRCIAEVDFADPAPVPAPIAISLDDLAERFREAVSRQMLSDVPVGAFLSGGVDSSLVVAAMRTAGGGPGATTFGIGFPAEPEVTSELPLAMRASRLLGTSHESVEEDAGTYFTRFAEAILQVEEPLAEPAMLLLSDLAAVAVRRVKVVLTGQGADEPLGGYPRHQAVRLALLLSSVLGNKAWARLTTGHERAARFLRVLGAASSPIRAAAPFSPLAPEEAGAAVRGCGAETGRAVILNGVERWWRRSEGMDDLARILYADVRTSLAEDLLLKGDKTAMAHGLESRVPFLDLEYLRLLESIPGPHRIPLWRRRKWIQLGLAQRVLPAALARELTGSRNPFRRKLAFEVPMAGWLRKGFGDRLQDVIAGPRSMLPQFVDRAFLLRTCERYLRSRHQAFRNVFALYVLEVWLRALVGRVPVAELPAATA